MGWGGGGGGGFAVTPSFRHETEARFIFQRGAPLSESAGSAGDCGSLRLSAVTDVGAPREQEGVGGRPGPWREDLRSERRARVIHGDHVPVFTERLGSVLGEEAAPSRRPAAPLFIWNLLGGMGGGEGRGDGAGVMNQAASGAKDED